MTRIFHITSSAELETARAAGALRPASLASEGFVHCSTEAQLMPVAQAFFAGRDDLVVVEIDPARLGASLIWEAGTGEPPAPGPFPHVYGPIPLDTVVAVRPLALP